LRIVLDTNVVVSALLTPAGIPSKVLNIILEKYSKLIYDNSILAEYINVLSRKEFKIDRKLADLIMDFIISEGEFITAVPLKIKFVHEEDKKFYELYKSGEADYLITGNIRHFPKEKGIVTPKIFLEQETFDTADPLRS
jgi:putative PIN family toxin of toxin-antitoxin system